MRKTASFLDAPASCPCFSRGALSRFDQKKTRVGTPTADYYLFFDVFNYYGLDARRTEARALVSAQGGVYEEVASVYITYGSGPDDLHLICYRQDVVDHPVTGDPTYRYQTLAPSVEEAEACRQTIVASVGGEEPCQGAACGLPYTKEQLDSEYPAYTDDGYRAPAPLLDVLRKEIADVQRLLSVPA